MTSPAEIIYCADLAALLARATEYAAAGAQLDATNRAEGALYQPAIIVYSPGATVILRLNAMAEGTHYTRRTHAFNAADVIIAQARAAVATEYAHQPQPADLAEMPICRALMERLTQNATAATLDAAASALAAIWTAETETGFKSILGTLQAVSEFGAEYYNAEERNWTPQFSPGCLLTETEAANAPEPALGATIYAFRPFAHYTTRPRARATSPPHALPPTPIAPHAPLPRCKLTSGSTARPALQTQPRFND